MVYSLNLFLSIVMYVVNHIDNRISRRSAAPAMRYKDPGGSLEESRDDAMQQRVDRRSLTHSLTHSPTLAVQVGDGPEQKKGIGEPAEYGGY